MDVNTILRTQYELKELELNSLLEVTQAINNNLSEDSLYKIFNFTLRANLNIQKLALYVLMEEERDADRWECKTNFGTEISFTNIMLNEHFLPIKQITKVEELEDPGFFDEFDIVIPVSHKNSVLALVFLGGLQKEIDGQQTEIGTTFIQALSNIIIVAIENKKLARRQLAQEAMRKEMEIARQVQQFLFPKELPQHEGLQVEASYMPHHSVGGDYYDFIKLTANHSLFCIADVSGKGVPAAILMSNFQAALRTIVRQTMNLKEVIPELNYQVLQSANGENFITFFIAIYDQQAKQLRYVNAGHTPPMLINESKKIQLMDQGTVMLGSFHPLPFLNEGLLEDIDNFMLFAYTDGLTETFNQHDEEYGMERLEKFLVRHADLNLPDIHRYLFKELDEYSGGNEYHDDITFMSVMVNNKFDGGAL
ncbi:sigma-B regulation protein RsbU (phosphoserine phosphatase) [Catalinimonas alkaloidigena]|uniref:PP2C family protein-serine/threonine phosphatase n=1 Tax=Catalinimonas alkaloidigena TaxID=1075417 RepID=UPI002404F72E|nr:PP2C family protein-serine/threonine phosphatase [Catalinimonas alkaloidigena]MDF9801229.1 sigma-B regulation protein RsbU (phosphoserine phosphatase) [Catalinimonas alkaloidigena]